MTKEKRKWLWLGTLIQIVGGIMIYQYLGLGPMAGIGILLWGYGLTEEARRIKD